jgi:hypothetical protein
VIALAVAGLAAAACVALIFVLTSRDPSGVSTASGPGTLLPDRGDRRLPAGAPAPPAGDLPASGPHHVVPVRRDGGPLSDDQLLTALAAGNVVIVFDGSAVELRRLQRSTAGPFTPDLATAGQAVILDRRPGQAGTVALAWRRRLITADQTDPRLEEFVNAWLGQGPGR